MKLVLFLSLPKNPIKQPTNTEFIIIYLTRNTSIMESVVSVTPARHRVVPEGLIKVKFKDLTKTRLIPKLY